MRERAAAVLAPPPARHTRLADAGDTGWVTRPDLQPPRATSGTRRPYAARGTLAVADDWPPGMAVTALAADPIGGAQQDVYYVQRNVIALARGLSATGPASGPPP